MMAEIDRVGKEAILLLWMKHVCVGLLIVSANECMSTWRNMRLDLSIHDDTLAER